MTVSLQDSMRRPLRHAAAAALAALLLCAACSASDDSGTGGSCTQARCDSICREGGLPGGACVGEICSCLGGGGDGDADADGDGGGGGDVGDGCDERARWIYVVSAENQLIRFYPDELRLEPVGTLQATALIVEAQAELAYEASLLEDRSAARKLFIDGVRAAKALARAVPGYSLELSPDGRFWELVEEVLSS